MCVNITENSKRLCLILLCHFEMETCFLKGHFSGNCSEDGKFVEAIMKQTKMKTDTKPGLSLFLSLGVY